MSASNWAICPACQKNRENEIDEFEIKINDSYGKVPTKEYLELVAKSESLEAVINNPSLDLREYYEIGIDDNGEFYVIYNSSCEVCKFSYDYRFSQLVDFSKWITKP